MIRTVLLLVLVLPGGSPSTELVSVGELERAANPAEARLIALRIERSFPERKPQWKELYRVARALEKHGLVDLASRLVREHWEVCGGEHEYYAHALVADMLLRANRLDDALPEAEQALYLARIWEGRKGWARTLTQAHRCLATIHHRRGDAQRAIPHYRAAASRDFELDIAECQLDAGDSEGARVTLRGVLANGKVAMSVARRALRLYAVSAHEDGRLREALDRLASLDKKARIRFHTPLAMAEGLAKKDPDAIVEAYDRKPSGDLWKTTDLQTAGAYLMQLDREPALAALRRRIAGGDLAAVDIVGETDLTALVPALEARAARERDATRVARIRTAIERLRAKDE